MKNRSLDWYVPPDIGCFFLIPAISAILSIAAGVLLPVLGSGNVLHLFFAALAFAILGAVLLFFSRLPLYRQRQFFVFGSRELSGIHRKLYRWAYVLLGVSLFLLAVIWLRIR